MQYTKRKVIQKGKEKRNLLLINFRKRRKQKIKEKKIKTKKIRKIKGKIRKGRKEKELQMRFVLLVHESFERFL